MSAPIDESNLEDEIFGADSDLSDVQSDNEAPRQLGQFDPDLDGGSDAGQQEESDDDEDAGDEFRPSKQALKEAAKEALEQQDGAPTASSSTQKLPKIKKKKRSAEDGEAEAAPRRKKKRARTPEEPVEEILTPEEARRRALDAKLDAIIKPMGQKKRKKKGEEGEDLGSALEEDVVKKLRDAMGAASLEDLDAHAAGKPAVAKLRMLQRVSDTLQKGHLEVTALDHGILTPMRQWLEPLPNRALPALTIQRVIFDLLTQMKSIDSNSLRESEMGKIVMFYTKCERVDPVIRRQASKLIQEWMRPLLRRNAAWRDRVVPKAQRGAGEDDRRPKFKRDQSTAKPDILRSAVINSKKDERHARIPEGSNPTFAIAPRARTQAVTEEGTHFGSSLKRFAEFKKQLNKSKSNKARD